MELRKLLLSNQVRNVTAPVPHIIVINVRYVIGGVMGIHALKFTEALRNVVALEGYAIVIRSIISAVITQPGKTILVTV